MPPKLYAYVDESGQDTRGQFFVVSIVILDADHETILHQLEAIEARSRKGKVKWHRARYMYRQAYIDELANLTRLSRSLFFESFGGSQAYVTLTVTATANAVRQRTQGSPCEVTVFVDGLLKHEAVRFAGLLRTQSRGIRKVRGVQKEQNNAFIRLADALCGLVRDAEEGNSWAQDAVRRLQMNGLLEAL
jgi:uncharacterized protein DUF3800